MTNAREVAEDLNQQSVILHCDIDEPWQDLSMSDQGTYHSTGSETSKGNMGFTDTTHLAPLMEEYSLMVSTFPLFIPFPA